MCCKSAVAAHVLNTQIFVLIYADPLTVFCWSIPQDPQPFPAPHRKPHALCIAIQAYFGAEKRKIERNTELLRLLQSAPQLLMFLWKTRSCSDHTELPREEHMKYLALSSLLALVAFKLKLPAAKIQKIEGWNLIVCFCPIIIGLSLCGEGVVYKINTICLGWGQDSKICLRGFDDKRKGGTWDLINAWWKACSKIGQDTV